MFLYRTNGLKKDDFVTSLNFHERLNNFPFFELNFKL